MLIPGLLAGTAWLLAATRPSGPPPPTLADVQRMLADGHIGGAMAALGRALPHTPPDAATRTVLAQVYGAACDPATGEPNPRISNPAARIAATLQDALADGQGTAEDYRLLGEFALAGGLASEAAPALLKAAAMGVDPAAVQLPLALAMLRVGNMDALLQAVQPDRVADPHLRAKLLVVRGEALEAMGHDDDAQASFQNAAKADPANVEAYARLGLMELGHAKTGAAKAWLAKAEGADAAASPTLRLRGEYDYAVHDYAGSRKAFTTLVTGHAAETYDPIPPSLGKARAEIYLGALKQAAATLDGAPLNRTDPHLVFYRALLEFRAGSFRRAGELAEPLDGSLADFPPLELLIGGTMLANGFPATAATRLREYLALVPGNTAAKALLADADDRLAHPNLPLPIPVDQLLESFGFPPSLASTADAGRL